MNSTIATHHDKNFPIPPSSRFLPLEEHVVCRDWREMRRIQLPETNLAMLKRDIPPVSGAVGEILDHPLGEAQMVFERGMELDLIPAMLDDELDLTAPDSQTLYLDIRELAEEFLAVTGALKIGVRLERVTTDSCRLFHVDRLEVRLLTTYFGAGTEWLRNADVKRAGLGQGDDALVKKEAAEIQVMPAGWVGLLKGQRDGNALGLVHRSPRIEASGEKRVLLRMDTLG